MGGRCALSGAERLDLRMLRFLDASIATRSKGIDEVPLFDLEGRAAN